MRRFLKIVAGTLAAVVVAGALVSAWMLNWGRLRPAHAMPAALTAATSDERVDVVDEGRWVVFRPKTVPVRLGVILYPGARCDVRGYAPVLRRVAEAGYLVVDVRMPLDMAIFAPTRALDVEPAFPDVRHWALIGHSMGGAMAGWFVHGHPDAVDGLVIWDAYPPDSSSLAALHKPVWHIHRATRDGAPPESFAKRRGLFPPDSHWVPVRGGIHMYFGAFEGGGYEEDWPPLISRETQHDQVVAATVEALHDIDLSVTGHP